MPKKRKHPQLRVVPPPPAAPPTFEDQVARARELYKTQDHGAELHELMCRLAGDPATTSVHFTDATTLYFALAAWYWQAEAIRREGRYCRAQEEAEALAEERDEVYTDAIVEGEWVLRGLIQQLYAQLGASGAPDPTLQEACAWLMQEFPETMRKAMDEAEAQREAAREAHAQVDASEAE